MIKILVLGVTGMLGNAMLRVLAASEDLEVYGTARQADAANYFPEIQSHRIIAPIDVENTDALYSGFCDCEARHCVQLYWSRQTTR